MFRGGNKTVGKEKDKMICDICGYEHPIVVRKDPDGILRCKICRHNAKYGEYIHSPIDEEKRAKKGKFTDYWISITAPDGS